MLNARYVITGDEDAPVVRNTSAMGSAWLVDSIAYVKGADAEMEALYDLDVRNAAVADARFRDVLGSSCPTLEPGDTIMLTSYTPNRLTYTVDTRNGGIGVFSEVYFPWGWKASVDGRPAELGRVNYLLRAMRLPAGRHEVVMAFEPDSIRTTGVVAYACVSLVYLLVLAGVFGGILKKEERK